MDNEYRAAIKEFRLSWLEREYGELFSAGHVSAPIAKWIKHDFQPGPCTCGHDRIVGSAGA